MQPRQRPQCRHQDAERGGSSASAPAVLDGTSCLRQRHQLAAGRPGARRSACSAAAQFNFKHLNDSCPETESFGFWRTTAFRTASARRRVRLPRNPTWRAAHGTGGRAQAPGHRPETRPTATIRDLTTGRKGSTTASAVNGFMETSSANCGICTHLPPLQRHRQGAERVAVAVASTPARRRRRGGHGELSSKLYHRGFREDSQFQGPARHRRLRLVKRDGESTTPARCRRQVGGTSTPPSGKTRRTEGTGGLDPVPEEELHQRKMSESLRAP